ncbi:hypothetical protein [Flavobacterium sp.]|jgi:hypothetical protein|uniref:hypothetical protein n=1 Tax=Flavobacterium sp. TaxID=239 RepID=UPI0037C0E1AC
MIHSFLWQSLTKFKIKYGIYSSNFRRKSSAKKNNWLKLFIVVFLINWANSYIGNTDTAYLKRFKLENPNQEGIELREVAKPDFILMTTEGNFGESQILRLPENTFEFPLPLMLCMMTHEMVHAIQKKELELLKDGRWKL